MRPHHLVKTARFVPSITLVLCLTQVFGLTAQEAPEPATQSSTSATASAGQTLISLKSGFPVGLYLIESLYIEPSGKSIDSNITITGKKMTQLAVSPAELTLPNGDYSLNIGSGNDFNHMIVLKATGQSREIIVHGDATVSRVAGIATIILGLAAFICAPNASTMITSSQVDGLGIAGLVCSGLALGGAVTWGVSAPWVEVR